MSKRRERGVFPLDATPLRNTGTKLATPLRNAGTKLATPLRNTGTKLVLFVSRPWLRHFLQSLTRRYSPFILTGVTGLIALIYVKRRKA